MQRKRRKLAPRISTKTWDQHYWKIWGLYTEEGRKLKGHEGVIKIMARDHGFIATEAQYEAFFRRKKIRKNMTTKEWNFILPELQKSLQVGMRTIVQFEDITFSEDRIAREINRRLPNCNIRPRNAQEPSPLSPVINLQPLPNTADDDRDPTVSVASPTNASATTRRYLNTNSGEIRKLHHIKEWHTFFSQVMRDFTASGPSPSPMEADRWSKRLEFYQDFMLLRLYPVSQHAPGCLKTVVSIEHGNRVLKMTFEWCKTQVKRVDSIEELVNSEEKLSSQSQGLNHCEHCGLSPKILSFQFFVTKIFIWDGESWYACCEVNSLVDPSLDYLYGSEGMK